MSDEVEEPRAGDLVGEGWAGLDALDKKFANAPKLEPSEFERLAGVAQSLFSSDQGRQVLEWMISSTLRRASVPDIGAELMLMKPEDLASYVMWNEAQKAFVLRLIGLMEAGKRTKKPRRTKR
jgi:hypothetical protein